MRVSDYPHKGDMVTSQKGLTMGRETVSGEHLGSILALQASKQASLPVVAASNLSDNLPPECYLPLEESTLRWSCLGTIFGMLVETETNGCDMPGHQSSPVTADDSALLHFGDPYKIIMIIHQYAWTTNSKPRSHAIQLMNRFKNCALCLSLSNRLLEPS